MTKQQAPLQHIVHGIAPVYDARSRVLILGSLPSPASRSFGFFYGHPQNLFWPLMAQLLREEAPPATLEARRAFALEHRFALWDVLHSGDIAGAADSSIKNAVANDFTPIFAAAAIRAVFTTGKAAWQYYQRLCAPHNGRPAIYLPSTSPANRAAQQKPEFLAAWQQILDYL